jgi:hypothetical protein
VARSFALFGRRGPLAVPRENLWPLPPKREGSEKGDLCSSGMESEWPQ